MNWKHVESYQLTHKWYDAEIYKIRGGRWKYCVTFYGDADYAQQCNNKKSCGDYIVAMCECEDKIRKLVKEFKLAEKEETNKDSKRKNPCKKTLPGEIWS